MSDAIWYGRLLIWIGAFVLLIEAIAGRSNGLTDLLAVLMVIVGFGSLVYGLVSEGLAARNEKTDPNGEPFSDPTES